MKPSPYPYEAIMEAISAFQGELSAVVILQNADNSTTYLRHNISQENMASMLNSAYSTPPTDSVGEK